MVAYNFSGKTALVTGGTRGLGHAIARGFADVGADVWITGTRDEATYETDLASLYYRRVDVADRAAVDALASEIPRLDVLVNNAGVTMFRGRAGVMEDYRRVIEVNLLGAMNCCEAFHPALEAARGNVVNLSSIVARLGTRGNPAYGTSKGGIEQLTRSLAVAWAPDGIRVNAIAPGFVKTDMTEMTWDNEAANEAVIARTPLGRWGAVGDVVGPALFVASDEAAGFVTGATLVVDGGYSVSA